MKSIKGTLQKGHITKQKHTKYQLFGLHVLVTSWLILKNETGEDLFSYLVNIFIEHIGHTQNVVVLQSN